jgi:hypothetical protein
VKLSPKQIDLSQDVVMSGGNVYLSSGSASTPALLFSDHTNTGIYLVSAAKIGISTSGVQRLFVNTASVTSNLQIRGVTGSASTPSYAFNSAFNTGMFLDSGNLSLTVGGNVGLTLQSDGSLILEGTTSLKLPTGSSSQRPSSVSGGMTRFNSDNNVAELYDGSYWLNIQAGGGEVKAIKTITENYTPTRYDFYLLVDASGGAITITLPTAVTGTTYIVKKIDSSSNTVTVNPPSSKTIDGDTSVDTTKQFTSFTLTTDSTNWFLV